jgi:signal transduction histidine kinase
MARAVIAAVVFGYILNTLLSVVAGGLRGAALAGFVVCLALAFGLQLAHSTRAPLTWPAWTRAATLSAQAVVTFLPFVWVGPQAGSLAGFLIGSVLLAVVGAGRWWLSAGLLLAVLAGLWGEGLAPVDVAYSVYFSALTGLMIYGVSSLVSLVGLVYSARDEMSWMAVARERLRVARDLHDLLGFNVSAMMLKSELAYRLLPMAVDRAGRELRDVLEVAHRALADVRVVAGGDRRMSMAAETETAQAMLAAAEMRVTVRSSVPDLPEELDTVLAIVMREAATNVLRHSKAEHCCIEAAVHDGHVRLLVRNDGVEPEPDSPGGSGLDNLADRMAAIGGRVAVSNDGEWFQLTATAPLPSGRTATAPPSPPDEGEGEVTAAEPAARPWHRRVARTITVLVLSGYGLLVIVNVLPEEPGGAGLLGFAACVAVLVGFQIIHSLREPRHWPILLRAATLSVQAAASFLPLLWIGTPWGSMGGFLAGSLLLLLNGALRWIMFTVTGATVLLVSLSYSHDAEWMAYLTLSTLLTGLVVYSISSLSGLVKEVDQARIELARVAVTKERLRVARELRHRLGELLSAMTVKGERAIRLLPRSPEGARAEVAEMLDIARVAVANIRSVATGYRHMSFTAELDSAATALAAAGIEADVDVREQSLPEPVDALLAMVLREAVTNMIRHSEARTCAIAVGLAGGGVRLEVTNDGAPEAAQPGIGLEDLADRLRSVGGDLTAEAVTGTFRLVAEVPMSMAGE